MGGSGGHSDTAAGAKLSIIIAPMFRARLPHRDRQGHVCLHSGRDIDVLVTQGGIAVNPRNADLRERLLDAGIPVIDIHELKEKAEKITGVPPDCQKATVLLQTLYIATAASLTPYITFLYTKIRRIKMREISSEIIAKTVRRLCIEANCYLPADIKIALKTVVGRKPGRRRRKYWNAS
ncbi:MAG: citrate lyase subunit alpha [Acetivibrionales bacterium]